MQDRSLKQSFTSGVGLKMSTASMGSAQEPITIRIGNYVTTDKPEPGTRTKSPSYSNQDSFISKGSVKSISQPVVLAQ